LALITGIAIVHTTGMPVAYSFELEKENQRLKGRLRKAEIIIEAQKKISEILGVEQNLEDIESNK